MRKSQAHLIFDQFDRKGWVKHRENGVLYGFDFTEVMFASGNASEKIRIASLCQPGEILCDLYAGTMRVKNWIPEIILHEFLYHLRYGRYSITSLEIFQSSACTLLRVEYSRGEVTIHTFHHRNIHLVLLYFSLPYLAPILAKFS